MAPKNTKNAAAEKTEKLCPGLHGVPCGEPREAQQSHCKKHWRQYMREWYRKKKLRNGLTQREVKELELVEFVELALESEDPRLQRRAAELAERYGINGRDIVAEKAPGARFQALLDKHAATE